jgi:hypothetical protein
MHAKENKKEREAKKNSINALPDMTTSVTNEKKDIFFLHGRYKSNSKQHIVSHRDILYKARTY